MRAVGSTVRMQASAYRLQRGDCIVYLSSIELRDGRILIVRDDLLTKKGCYFCYEVLYMTWGVGLLSGLRQKWVLDRAGVYNLAQTKTLAYTPAGPNRQ